MVFPPQKPRRRAVERDETRIRRWIEQDWPRIKRRARRRLAHLVFADETGFLLTPWVRRSWAPRGRTPVLRDRMRHRRKLSAIGAITISPKRRRLGHIMHLHEQAIGEAHVVAFLRDLLRQLRGDIVLVWDNLGAHRSAMVRDYIDRHRRLVVEPLPPYAPELNAQEYAWGHFKTGPLANLCPANTDELAGHVSTAACAIQREQALLRGFVRATGLPTRLNERVTH